MSLHSDTQEPYLTKSESIDDNEYDDTKPPTSKRMRRTCKYDGCTSIVKSQGLCQRHGAKPKRCRIEGCEKQLQGSFDGMCKQHYKKFLKGELNLLETDDRFVGGEVVLPESVYDHILPDSLVWDSDEEDEMPLVRYLREGFESNQPVAWHRNQERQSRGLYPVRNPSVQLEGWERELVWTEILLLTGNADASFRHLAYAWGRDKSFHMVLAQFICKRHGDVQRKTKDRKSFKDINNVRQDKKTTDSDASVLFNTCFDDVSYDEELAQAIFELYPDYNEGYQSNSDAVSNNNNEGFIERVEPTQQQVYSNSQHNSAEQLSRQVDGVVVSFESLTEIHEFGQSLSDSRLPYNS